MHINNSFELFYDPKIFFNFLNKWIHSFPLYLAEVLPCISMYLTMHPGAMALLVCLGVALSEENPHPLPYKCLGDSVLSDLSTELLNVTIDVSAVLAIFMFLLNDVFDS